MKPQSPYVSSMSLQVIVPASDGGKLNCALLPQDGFILDAPLVRDYAPVLFPLEFSLGGKVQFVSDSHPLNVNPWVGLRCQSKCLFAGRGFALPDQDLMGLRPRLSFYPNANSQAPRHVFHNCEDHPFPLRLNR